MKRIFFFIFGLNLLLGCQKEEITISTRAADHFFLKTNGASMPVRVYGNTASKTYMIMVHGGPGGDAIEYRIINTLVEKVEAKYAVVYWDQRNSGISQGGANGQFNQVADFVADFEKLITLLKYRYGTDISIFVNGHSWGGHLTPAFLQKDNNQYSVKGWIHSDGAHNIPLLNQYAIEKMLEKAEVEIQAGRNVKDWQEIKAYCLSVKPPFTTENSLKINTFAAKAESLTEEVPKSKYGAAERLKNYDRENTPLTQLLLKPFGNPAITSLVDKLFGQGDAQLSDNMHRITIPTLILFGKHDYVCPPKLGDDVESRILSAYKRKVLFEHSGHGPMGGADEVAYWDEVMAFMERFR